MSLVNKNNIDLLIHEIYRSGHKIQLKHDIACRKVAKFLKANSVSILLYSGAENELICRGKYIDPGKNRGNAKPLNQNQAPNIIRVQQHIDFFEFFEMRNCLPESEMFSEYLANKCCDETIQSKGKFKALVNDSRELTQAYKIYKECFCKEKHPVGLSTTTSGVFYYILHHYDANYLSLNQFDRTLKEGSGNIFPDTKICISDITLMQSSMEKCRKILKNNLEIDTSPGSYYIGIPIKGPDGRLIGILRIILGDYIVSQISKMPPNAKGKDQNLNEKNSVITKVYKYIVFKFNIERVASIIGEELNYHELIEGFYKISLKGNLNQEFLDYNKLAEELAAVINCFGCIIRTSKGLHDAQILGYSKSVEAYVKEIKSSFDPYIIDDRFKDPLVDLFYNPSIYYDEKYSSKNSIVSIKIYIEQNGTCKVLYQYINDKQEIIDTPRWTNKLKDIEKGLQNLYSHSIETFKRFDISEVVILPIKEIKYGFIALANKSVHPFVKNDFKLIIPVVRRVGFEYKQNKDHIRDKEKLKQETLIHSTRIMFHQLGSPITSLRNHIINIRRKLIPEDKIALRLQDMESTYQDFLDMIGTNQFFFEYATKGTINLESKEFNLFEFVKERIRTYQLRAKKERGLDISVDQTGSQKFGVISDKRLLGHVIQSLIDNAIKYSFTLLQREEPWVKSQSSLQDIHKWIIVNVRNTAEEFSIAVTNWGCRIGADEIGKIKTLEYRGREANQFASVGSGIGLYVVDLIVEKILHGKFDIQHSSESHKTVMTVTFNK